MNKNVLITSGVAVVSLAVGGAAGYFVAAKKLGTEFDARLAEEVAGSQAYYETRLGEETQRLAEENLSDDVDTDKEDFADEPSDDEILEALATKKARLETNGKAALTNYQSFAEKPDLADVVASNVFDRNKGKKALPPKDPATGRFLPKQEERVVDEPHIISEEDFLADDDFDTQYLMYFINEKTLVHVHDNDEAVDVILVGEANLTLFADDRTAIFVRNPQLQTNFEIQPMTESLTERIGLSHGIDPHL